ncbi:MAG: hypothetical protein GKS05_06035 [Nitrospirales bacterium]|nr:hypothetical protein [Nitrospirales bacterium]
MKQTRRVISLAGMVVIVWSLFLHGGEPLFAQEKKPQAPPDATRTIIADLLDVDRDFYIVRGPLGEIQIEATGKTDVTEDFGYGDRIKAIVLPDNKALRIERAGPQEMLGITANVTVTSSSQQSEAPTLSVKAKPDSQTAKPNPAIPDTKTIIADILDVDGDFYVVRSEQGEIRIEATLDTTMTEKFMFGDRIKATVAMNDTALRIERAGPDDIPGIVIHRAASVEDSKDQPAQASPNTKKGEPTTPPSPTDEALKPEKTVEPEVRTVEGQILMIDEDLYVLRGERGEIRIEVTPTTHIAEAFKFGDRIKATIFKNDKALKIERAP